MLYAQDFQPHTVLDCPPAAPVGCWGFGWCFLCLFFVGGICRKGMKPLSRISSRCLRWSLSCSTPRSSTPFLAHRVTSDPLLFQRAGAANPHGLGREGESCQLWRHGYQILVTLAGEGTGFGKTNARAKQAASAGWSLLLMQRWELCRMPSCWSFAGSGISPPPCCTEITPFKAMLGFFLRFGKALSD